MDKLKVESYNYFYSYLTFLNLYLCLLFYIIRHKSSIYKMYFFIFYSFEYSMIAITFMSTIYYIEVINII